ncbi:MAG: twin-arginine translocation signal domain-containing protein, partial [Rhizobacter sp.]
MPCHWTRRQALRSTAAAAGALACGPLWAQDAKEIRIGQSVHLSGPLATTMT